MAAHSVLMRCGLAKWNQEHREFKQAPPRLDESYTRRRAGWKPSGRGFDPRRLHHFSPAGPGSYTTAPRTRALQKPSVGASGLNPGASLYLFHGDLGSYRTAGCGFGLGGCISRQEIPPGGEEN